MDKIWRAVPGWPYDVSDQGDVRSWKGNVLKPRKQPNGYTRVYLCDKGKKREVYIHRLVCSVFYPTPELSQTQAHHRNRDKSDNRLSNLEWITPEGNRALRHIAKGESCGNAVLTEMGVRIIRKLQGMSNIEIGLIFGVHRRTVWDITNNRRWKHVA